MTLIAFQENCREPMAATLLMYPPDLYPAEATSSRILNNPVRTVSVEEWGVDVETVQSQSEENSRLRDAGLSGIVERLISHELMKLGLGPSVFLVPATLTNAVGALTNLSFFIRQRMLSEPEGNSAFRYVKL